MKHAPLLVLLFAAFGASGSEGNVALDDMSLEELVKTDITSVSRKSQSLADVAAAAFVISSDDIRRSGARALPDVLRMAPGIQVAQIDNGRYAVTARSLNGRFATKLQVLVDGRSIYHPLFAGVMWELDPIPLADIERIEVIRGPGAVMWGVNAVNGLINIISKSARNQHGTAISAVAGTQGTGEVYARFGRASGDDSHWKLSAQARHIEPSQQKNRTDKAGDRLDNTLADFRLDKALGNGRDLSLWANASRSSTNDFWMTQPDLSQPGLVMSPIKPAQVLNSESLVGRYRWLGNQGIESSLQGSMTRSGIKISNFITENRNTLDLDYQGRLAFNVHDLTWGLSYSQSTDDIVATQPYLSILGRSHTRRNTGVFLQDDWTLVPETFKLGLGGRVDQTSRNGSNVSANATLLWTPSRTDSLWAKWAQAPRTSTRGERDISILVEASVMDMGGLLVPIITNNNASGQLDPEMARGFEFGYRKQFASSLNADIAAYRYRLSNLRSARSIGTFTCSNLIAGMSGGTLAVNPAKCAYFGLSTAGALGTPIIFNDTTTANGLAGWNDGIELSVEWLVTAAWRLQFSYTWSTLKMDRPGTVVMNADSEITERAHPHHIGSLRSQWNIAANQQFDVWLRGSSGSERQNLVNTTPVTNIVPTFTRVPGYITVDLRYAYHWNKDLEIALIGRNLLQRNRVEFISDYIPSAPAQIAPTWMLTSRWTF